MADIPPRIGKGFPIFEWDDSKAIANWKKHRVSFEAATKVFDDKNAVILPDLRHSDFEERKRIIGSALDVVSHVRILFVVYVERVKNREGRVIRIISARDANKEEAKIYERGLSSRIS